VNHCLKVPKQANLLGFTLLFFSLMKKKSQNWDKEFTYANACRALLYHQFLDGNGDKTQYQSIK